MNVAHAGRPHAPEMLKAPGPGSYQHHPNSPLTRFQISWLGLSSFADCGGFSSYAAAPPIARRCAFQARDRWGNNNGTPAGPAASTPHRSRRLRTAGRTGSRGKQQPPCFCPTLGRTDPLRNSCRVGFREEARSPGATTALRAWQSFSGINLLRVWGRTHNKTVGKVPPRMRVVRIAVGK